jgi:hypothetical protein
MTHSTDKDTYCVKSNLGTKEKPFYVERELGAQESIAHAQHAGFLAINDCTSFLEWYLFKNDINTQVKLETAPKPEKGFVYQLNVTGDTVSDLELAIEEAVSHIDNEFGFDSNETGSFSFNRVGTEFIEPDQDIMSANWFFDEDSLEQFIPRDDEYQSYNENHEVVDVLLRLGREGETNEQVIIDTVHAEIGVSLATIAGPLKRYNAEDDIYYSV